MTLMVNFTDAHRRHWKDAEFLYVHERWGNADHLFGFSAECGLKAVMTELGMPLKPSGDPMESEHRKHIRDLWLVFQSFAGRRGASVYLRELPPGTPFSDWSHQNRYSRTGFSDKKAVDQHREAARGILHMVSLAEQDGTP